MGSQMASFEAGVQTDIKMRIIWPKHFDALVLLTLMVPRIKYGKQMGPPLTALSKACTLLSQATPTICTCCRAMYAP